MRRTLPLLLIILILLGLGIIPATAHAQDTIPCDPNTDFEATIADLNGDWEKIIPVATCWVQSQPDNPLAYGTLADTYWYLGDYENAALAYEQGAKKFPTDVYFLAAAADTYWGMGNLETCLERTTTALEIDPQYAYAQEIAMHCLYDLGEYAQVIELGTTWRELHPDATAGLFNLADSYRLMGDCENSLAIVEIALVLAPEDPIFADVQAGCNAQTTQAPAIECDPNTDYLALYAELDKISAYDKESRDTLICAIQSDPTNLQLPYDLIVLDYLQGNPESALLYGPMLMEQNPSVFTFTSFVAWGYAVTGQTYECYQLAKQIPTFFSEPLDPEFTIGIDKTVVALKCAYEIGDIDLILQLASLVSHPESDGILAYVLARYIGADPQYILELAQSAYDLANEQDLESPYPTVGLAFALFANGRAEDALAIMTEGVERFPTSYMYAMRSELYVIIYYNLNPVDAYLDNYFADVQTALELDPTGAWGLIMAGMTGASDAETVISYGEQVMALYPHIKWLFSSTVTSYTLPEQCEAMLQYIDSYLAYYPDDEVALFYKNDPERCGGVTIEPATSAECDPNTDFETTIANLNGDWAQIIPVAQCWVSSQPDNGEANITLGDAYWYVGEHEKSLDAYQQALTLLPDNTYVLTSIADVYLVMGDYETCLEKANYVLERNPEYTYPLVTVTLCAYGLGDYARVVEVGATWHELIPDSTTALFELADSYRALGDCENALAIVEEAKVLLPDDTRFADIQTACGG